MRLSALLCLLGLVPLTAWAASPGVVLYERGSYAQARRSLEGELLSSKLTETERGLARLYLAASLHALGEQAEARSQLEELARNHPKQAVDPALFPPDFVELAAEARQQVEAERGPGRGNERPASPENPFAQEEPPAASGRSRLLPEVFGFLDPVGKAVGVGGGVTYGTGSFEVGARVLLGDQLGAGAQVGYVLGDGAFRPHLALRATAIPGLSAFGGGPVVGARLSLGSSLTALVDVGAELFKVSDEGYRSFVVSTSVGLGFDLLSP
ncbi:MAG TPA: tetratricopeptide repeat protein [Myxococcus sp.]|nr:tetratricopeptide repeat protein [Myxococcus sp.]